MELPLAKGMQNLFCFLLKYKMEITNHKQGGGGRFMKSKLVMSFYRAAKPAPSMMQYATKVESEPSAAAVQKLSFSKPGGGFPTSDGYVHGPKGVGGDEQVDTKATSYIYHVKERRKLEELCILNEGPI